MSGPTRDFAVSAFVVWERKVLLHRHKKLGLWLPPGGHVEPNETPDAAAVREVEEEAGIRVELVGERAVDAPGPLQLIRPRGVQLEVIAPGHEHIDLVYLARPLEPYEGRLAGEFAGEDHGLAWYDRRAAELLGLTPELSAWVELALREVDGVDQPADRRP